MSELKNGNIPEIFGSMVFNENVMKERLPKDVYKSLKKTISESNALDPALANVVANAMKDWAVSKGATHFTHWFQPMTGITAEKHDSFISPTEGGNVIMEFSGKELIRGEPDASSFPSGGIRSTFEARGYTVWDPTSYAFIKDGTLCIPTAFCSYSGEVLDKKTPLLRSMDAISHQALRIVKLFGNADVHRVTTTIGAEQEYFLIDQKYYDARPDLQYTGRTLIGAMPPKGQQLEDHYFGTIKPRVSAYMKELDEELWKLGILSKTKHNEVAPSQHELAPIFTTTNIATDHNQLTMEMMKKVALRHGLVCLLHEKPFAGVNGSGKHNNWSMTTDTGENLLEPGATPRQNAQFLLLLAAVIKAVDDYQDLLRVSVSNAGNDHRLGAAEAPPAIVSIFLGEELTDILTAIENDTPYQDKVKQKMTIGVSALPPIPRDTTDRNRTSPFAFTGNKFEFRMLGSSFSVACTNIMLNTAVAEILRQFAEELEAANDFTAAMNALVKRVVKEHKRIIFNGNGYDDAWVEEAKKRGLSNLRTTVEALPHYTDSKNVALFAQHGIYSEAEMRSRQESLLEEYYKTVDIEARTLADMVRKQVYPAVTSYIKELTEVALAKQALKIKAPSLENKLIEDLSNLTNTLLEQEEALEKALINATTLHNAQSLANHYRNAVLSEMNGIRATADTLERLTAEKYWPFPTYGKLLFGV